MNPMTQAPRMRGTSFADSQPTPHPLVAVQAAALVDRISITVVRDAAGWRFFNWSVSNGLTVQPPPSAEDCARYFESGDGATAYFTREYGDRLQPIGQARWRLESDAGSALAI